MSYPDRDGTWNPRPFRRAEDERPQEETGGAAPGGPDARPPSPWAPQPGVYQAGPAAPQYPDPAQPAPGYPAQPDPGQPTYRATAQAAVPMPHAAQARPEAAAQQHAPLPEPPPITLPARHAAEPSSQAVIARATVTPVETSRADADADAAAGAAARRLAAPAVTSAPLATPTAATDLAVGRPDEDPPPADGGEQADALARTGPSGRMARLHVGWHTVSRRGLASVSVAPSAAGLVIGHDRQHAPVPVRLFAPEPVRLALVGGVWAAQLLIFRAFALGARVTVVTTEPTAWIGFGERATGQYNRLTVLSGEQGVSGVGTAHEPVLAVYDLRVTGPATAPALGPWRSQLTILRQLDRPGVPALQEAQLTLLQRLGGEEATLATSALRLRRHSGQFLQFMADDMMALISDGTDRYLSLAQTRVEHEHVGPPRR